MPFSRTRYSLSTQCHASQQLFFQKGYLQSSPSALDTFLRLFVKRCWDATQYLVIFKRFAHIMGSPCQRRVFLSNEEQFPYVQGCSFAYQKKHKEHVCDPCADLCSILRVDLALCSLPIATHALLATFCCGNLLTFRAATFCKNLEYLGPSHDVHRFGFYRVNSRTLFSIKP